MAQTTPRNVLSGIGDEVDGKEAEVVDRYLKFHDINLEEIANENLLRELRNNKREATADERKELRNLKNRRDSLVAKLINKPFGVDEDSVREEIQAIDERLSEVKDTLKEMREPHNEKITPTKKAYDSTKETRVDEAVDLNGGDVPEITLDDVPTPEEGDK